MQAKRRKVEGTVLHPLSCCKEDFALFAHLIPCCQHYEQNKPKTDFEEQMQTLHDKFPGNRKEFTAFLIDHPINVNLRRFVEHKYPDYREGKAPWEFVICMMRNIFCHEYSFEWLFVRELIQVSLEFFGDRALFEEMMALYQRTVLEDTLKQPSSEDINDQDPYDKDQLVEDLLIFCELIPCRSNNSIIDDTFESVMANRARDFPGSWELFATYLKTHPANPEQEHACIDDFSWVMTIRMMRNILCHECDFRFECLKGLSKQCILFFGSKSAVESVLSLYRSLCNSSHRLALLPSKKKRSWDKWVKAVSSIQLSDRSNSCLVYNPLENRRRLFTGVNYVTEFISRLYQNTISEAEHGSDKTISFPKELIAVVGGNKAGKTTAALHLLYTTSSFLAESMKLPVKALIINLGDCKLERGEEKDEEKEKDKEKGREKEVEDLEYNSVLEGLLRTFTAEFVQQLDEPFVSLGSLVDSFRGLPSGTVYVILLDGIHHLFRNITFSPSRRRLVGEFLRLFLDELSPCRFVITSNTHCLIPIFEAMSAVQKESRLAKGRPWFRVFECPQQYATPFELKDLELLLRHYTMVRKHLLKEVIKHLDGNIDLSPAVLSSVVSFLTETKIDEKELNAEEACKMYLQSRLEDAKMDVIWMAREDAPMLNKLLLFASQGQLIAPRGALWRALLVKHEEPPLFHIKDQLLRWAVSCYSHVPNQLCS